MSEPILYGFFSAQAAELFGYTVYTTPTGGRVATTNVTPDVTGASYNWPDVEARGEVLSSPVTQVRTFEQRQRHACPFDYRASS